MGQAKRDTLWKEIETEGKWRKNMKQPDFIGKKDYKKKKQGDTQKEKKRKKDEKEKTQQKEIEEEWTKNDEKEEDKWWKKQKNKGRKNKRFEFKEGFTQKMKQKWKMTEAIFERGTKR